MGVIAAQCAAASRRLPRSGASGGTFQAMPEARAAADDSPPCRSRADRGAARGRRRALPGRAGLARGAGHVGRARRRRRPRLGARRSPRRVLFATVWGAFLAPRARRRLHDPARLVGGGGAVRPGGDRAVRRGPAGWRARSTPSSRSSASCWCAGGRARRRRASRSPYGASIAPGASGGASPTSRRRAQPSHSAGRCSHARRRVPSGLSSQAET